LAAPAPFSGPPMIPTLAQVLTAGSDAAGQSMTGIVNVDAVNFIGGAGGLTSLPIPGIADVLGSNNDAAGSDIQNVGSMNMINCLVDNFGMNGVGPAGIQFGGAATAGALYTATEKVMLQKVYDALRTFGFLT